MKIYIPIICMLFYALSYSNTSISFIMEENSFMYQTPKDRKLSIQEVQERGIDKIVTRVVANVNNIDLKSMARSAIFETSYGFRWKMVNLKTGKIILFKMDKNFDLISVRNSDNSKIM